MAHLAHDLIVLRIGQMLRIPGPADRAHGIPQAEKFDRDRPAECLLETFGEDLVFYVLEHAPSERDQLLIALREQPDLVEHPGHRTRGVGAAAETEDENPVAVLIVAHQEAISVAD